jgi:hypothetical protein
MRSICPEHETPDPDCPLCRVPCPPVNEALLERSREGGRRGVPRVTARELFARVRERLRQAGGRAEGEP